MFCLNKYVLFRCIDIFSLMTGLLIFNIFSELVEIVPELVEIVPILSSPKNRVQVTK